MPVDLSRLLSPITPSGKPDLDASDERIVAADALAARDRYADAAVKVAELFAEDVFDIRPIPYYLHAAFLEDGFRGLSGALSAVDNLIGPSFAALGPGRRKEDYVNKRLSWLFDKMSNAIEYHEKVRTKEWASWEPTLSLEVLDQGLAAGARVSERLASAIYAQAGMSLGQLVSRLRGLAQPLRAAAAGAAAAGPAAPQPVSPAPAREPSTGVVAAPEVASASPAPVARALDPLEEDALRRMELLVSPGFLDLCRRLKAFETLVEKHKFEKAAVLAADLAQAIQSFDPRAHFPQLFTRYVALQARHVRPLAEGAAGGDSAAFRALQQHCRVDLAGFVESDP